MSDPSVQNSRSGLPGEFFAVVSAVLFGCMPLIARTAYANGSNAYMVSSSRYLTGSLWMILFLFVKSKKEGSRFTLRVTGKEFGVIAALSVLYGATALLLYLSYNYIDSGLATTLHFTYPVIIMLLSAFLFHAAIRRKEILCLILCAAGIFLLYSPGGNVRPAGILIAAASGLSYAGFSVLFEHSIVKKLPVLLSTFWFSVFSTVLIGIAAALTGNFTLKLPLIAHLIHILLGLVASALAAVFYQRSVQLCGSIRTSMLSTLEPVTSIAIGYFVFRELLTIRSVFGILCILGACILLVYKNK